MFCSSSLGVKLTLLHFDCLSAFSSLGSRVWDLFHYMLLCPFGMPFVATDLLKKGSPPYLFNPSGNIFVALTEACVDLCSFFMTWFHISYVLLPHPILLVLMPCLYPHKSMAFILSSLPLPPLVTNLSVPYGSKLVIQGWVSKYLGGVKMSLVILGMSKSNCLSAQEKNQPSRQPYPELALPSTNSPSWLARSDS